MSPITQVPISQVAAVVVEGLSLTALLVQAHTQGILAAVAQVKQVLLVTPHPETGRTLGGTLMMLLLVSLVRALMLRQTTGPQFNPEATVMVVAVVAVLLQAAILHIISVMALVVGTK
jgi:hypothetical protein